MARVLQLCLSPDDVIGTLAAHVVTALEDAGHSVFSCYLKGSGQGQPRRGRETVYLGCTDRALRRQRGRIADEIADLCRRYQVDTCISHRYKPCDILTRVARRYSFSRKIATFHGRGEFDRLSRKLFARWALRSWCLVGVSRAVRDDLLAAHCGFRARNVVAIPNALDLSAIAANQLSREQARAALGLGQGRVVGSIARLIPKKSLDTLLRAMTRVGRDDFNVAIIGDGRARGDLEAMVRELGLEDRVSFLGEVPQAYRYVRAFDDFILPSREEAFGLVLLEAIAGGVLALGASVGGIPEVLGNDKFLFPSGDSDALAARLDWLLGLDEGDKAALCSEQYARARAHHDTPVYHRAWVSLIENGTVPG